MKRSLKHILATSALLFAGVSTSLFGDLADTIANLITKKDGTTLTRYSSDSGMRCYSIGKYGRTLDVLPRKTKDAILDLCENEFLGLKYNGDRDVEFTEENAKKGLIAPRAWYAVIDTNKAGYRIYESYDSAFKAAEHRSNVIYKKAFPKPETLPVPSAPKIKFPPVQKPQS